jgi:hypothetical protein
MFIVHKKTTSQHIAKQETVMTGNFRQTLCTRRAFLATLTAFLAVAGIAWHFAVGAPRTVVHRWVPGQRLTFRLEYLSASSADFTAGTHAAEMQTLSTKVEADLAAAVLEVNSEGALIVFALRKAAVQVVCDGAPAADQSATMRADLSRPWLALVNHDGRIRSVHLPRNTSSLSHTFVRALLAAGQVVLPGDAAQTGWQAREHDPNGEPKATTILVDNKIVARAETTVKLELQNREMLSPEAQQKLRRVGAVLKAEPVVALSAAPMTTDPCAALCDVAGRSRNAAVRAKAELELGTMARQLATTQPQRAAHIVRAMTSRLAAATSAASQRHYLLVLGNAGTKEALGTIAGYVGDDVAEVRAAAVAALRWIDAPKADRVLCKALRNDPAASVRVEAATALGFRAMTAESFAALKDAFLKDSATSVRRAALASIARTRNTYPKAGTMFNDSLGDAIRDVREESANLAAND